MRNPFRRRKNGAGSHQTLLEEDELPRIAMSDESSGSSERSSPIFSFEDVDVDYEEKIRNVLREFELFKKKNEHDELALTESKDSAPEKKKEPLWRRRLTNSKQQNIYSQGVFVQTYAEEVTPDIPTIIKQVSFDDKSSTRKSENTGSRSESRLSFVRDHSSFSDIFLRWIDESDMFSLDTPSYWTDRSSTEDSMSLADTTISSCPRRRRTDACSPRSESILFKTVQDMKLFAELLVKDASCVTTCLEEPRQVRRHAG